MSLPTLDPQQRLWFAIGLGVLGGATVASWGAKHLFSEGTTEKERKGMLAAAAIGLSALAIQQLLAAEDRWKAGDLESVIKKGTEYVQGGVK